MPEDRLRPGLDWPFARREDALYFADSGDPKTNMDIFTLELTGGAMPVPVTHGPGSEGEGQFSPDGHWIAYAASTETESGGEVFVEPFPPNGRPSGWSHPAAVASQSGDRMERSSSSSTGISSLLWRSHVTDV